MVATLERPKASPVRLAYSVAELEAVLPLHRFTIRAMLSRKQLNGVLVGNKWLIPADEVSRVFGIDPARLP